MPFKDDESARIQAADQLGLAFVRTIILLNGGAIIALFTFVGNSTENSLIQFSVSSIKCSITAFLIGITTTLVGLVTSYVFYANPSETKIHKFFDEWVVAINGTFGITSVVSFVWGVLSLIRGAN